MLQETKHGPKHVKNFTGFFADSLLFAEELDLVCDRGPGNVALDGSNRSCQRCRYTQKNWGRTICNGLDAHNVAESKELPAIGVNRNVSQMQIQQIHKTANNINENNDWENA